MWYSDHHGRVDKLVSANHKQIRISVVQVGNLSYFLHVYKLTLQNWTKKSQFICKFCKCHTIMKARVSPNPYSHNRSTYFQLTWRQKLEYNQCLDQRTRILAHLTYFLITPNVMATCVKLHASRGLFVLRLGMLSEMRLSSISEWIPRQHWYCGQLDNCMGNRL